MTRKRHESFAGLNVANSSSSERRLLAGTDPSAALASINSKAQLSDMEHSGWRARGYLPHCDGANLVQHITMRTAGSHEGVGGHLGQSLLAHPQAAQTVQSALLHFDRERYAVHAWCVMPNHVHVLAMQAEGWPLQRIVHSWKSFTANEINRILGRTGAVWQREYYDRYMRDDDDLSTAIQYVEQNPVKAGLVACASDWAWSSAYKRD